MAQTFEAAAAALLADQGHLLPDLSSVTVLVPHHHVRAPLVAALRAQLPDTAVFLPPRLTTLPALAASQSGVPDPLPDSVRLIHLHGLLSNIGWLEEAALWRQAQAMDDLLGEMDDARLAPPDDYAGFGHGPRGPDGIPGLACPSAVCQRAGCRLRAAPGELAGPGVGAAVQHGPA